MGRPLTLRITQAAENDLAEIWSAIAAESSEAVATRFVAAIEATFQPLRHFPFAGAARDYFAAGLRVTFHGRYVIYYKPLPNAVVIIRVIHGAQDIDELVARGELD